MHIARMALIGEFGAGSASKSSSDILRGSLPKLELLEVWNAENLSTKIREFCDSVGLKLGKVAQPIRCAVAGTPSAPGVFEV
ncbi:MAG: glutamate--tRNA ligase, partial [Gammaproteobacteria bacterium]|nr:glutamate--tRNA ligase [Gammaproteobacteria bacterium]